MPREANTIQMAVRSDNEEDSSRSSSAQRLRAAAQKDECDTRSCQMTGLIGVLLDSTKGELIQASHLKKEGMRQPKPLTRPLLTSES